MDGALRPMAEITARTAYFWNGGTDGILRILRCQVCGLYIHPPLPLCPRCHSWNVSPGPVSGRGTVYSFTISYYKWIEALPPPYVVAEIELAEQPGLLLTSNTIGVDPDDVEIGMPVEVCFIPNGDVFIPQFRPAGGHGR